MSIFDKVFGRNPDGSPTDSQPQDGSPDQSLPEGSTYGAPTTPDATAHAEPPAPVAEIASAPLSGPEAEGQSAHKVLAFPSRTPEATQDATAEASPEAEGEGNPQQQDGVRAFDDQGREVVIPREQWRTEVLPSMLQQAWDNPDQLYFLIVNSLNEGFAEEVTDAAKHLHETDTVSARGTAMWGVLLTQAGRLDEAREVLEGYQAAHPEKEDASVLVHLARVYAMQDDGERADKTLDHALEIEPNLEHGIALYAGNAFESGGDAGAEAALERLRQLPGAWRPQLWIARGALAAGATGRAMDLYREALDRAPRPVPPDMLMQLSGDLGSANLLPQMIDLTAPHFNPELHGMAVGNNLLKAFTDTGMLDAATQLHAGLQQFNRPDWKGALDFWANEILRRRAGGPAAGQPQQAEVQIGMLRLDGPIWLPAGSALVQFLGTKPEPTSTVTFLGGTAETPTDPADSTPQLADLLPRLTRAIPLFLAEQVDLLAAPAGRAMLPWAVSAPQAANAPAGPSGFVVSGQRWPDEMARQTVSAEPNRSDYVVTVHLDAEVRPWNADLAFIRSSDGTRIGEINRDFDPENPEAGLRELAAEVLELLGTVDRTGALIPYSIPSGSSFLPYILRLEQLLAIRCAAMPGIQPNFLNNEQDLLNSALQLARQEPTSLPARALLYESLNGIRTRRPELVAAMEGDVTNLDTMAPLGAPTQS